MIPSEWLDAAAARLAGRVHITPLVYDAELDLYLKWENRQKTGSFKLRGATNKVLSLQPWERSRGLVCASAGNHGQGVALAAQEISAPVIVFASDHAAPIKLAAMAKLGAEVRTVPGGYELAERTARDFAAEQDRAWISPYNDGQVIAGQATLGLELLEQLSPFPAPICLVPVGGGGLIAGIGLALRRLPHPPRLIGVQSQASAFFHGLFHRGTQADVIETDSLADGLAGAVEADAVTIPLVKSLVDDLVLVSEEQIGQAVAFAWQRYGEMIEGSAAVALAAVLNGQVMARPAVVVLTGGNIQPEIHAALVQRYGARE
ncbi:MAG TPA: pyridoxal-phosphate dependent enzyme [Anaerolineaceae bacterium]|jgi:threonine dehydratase|nr:pyridoxal-phosphate dependent enzyme [Anaerolineaceae bacterium]